MLAQLEADYPDDVRVVFRHFPLTIHDKANLAAQAAEAAGLQGMFWEMHDLLFGRQPDWSNLSPADFESWVIERAAELGMDADQFAADLISEAIVAKVQTAFDHGVEIGLPGTPVILMNGLLIDQLSYAQLLAVTKLLLLEQRQFSDCPEITIDPDKQYTATIHTGKGDIKIALYPDVAPFAVNNFIFLAENGWYENVPFHRVIAGFMAQGGDPTGTGVGGPGYYFSIEVSPTLTFDRPGLVAMANAGPTSNGSQFFITYGPAEHLNGSFTIFGEVIEGYDIAESLTVRDPQDPNAPPSDMILDITIEVK